MNSKLNIQFISDISCTWCAIGLQNLKQALNSLSDDIDVEIFFKPFELNPEMPVGGQNLVEHLQEKYGWDRQRTLETLTHIRRSGEPVGIDFQLGEESRIYNTFDAHRLLHWAVLHGKQQALKQAIFTAHFSHDDDPSNPTLLAQLAESVGLDKAEAHRIVTSDTYAQEVQQDEQHWRNLGVNSVPTIIFNDRYVTTGAQPPDAFRQIIRQVLENGTMEENTNE